MTEFETKLLEKLDNIAAALTKLGVNNANTSMGAIECLAKEVLDGTKLISNTLYEIGEK